MYGAVLPELVAARHADLLRDAARVRRVAAARHSEAIPSTAWRWRRRARFSTPAARSAPTSIA
jgi:hypothetical protein